MQSEKMTRTEAIKSACSIDGWLAEHEAALLYDLARAARGPIVEIGSWKGRSTAALALGSMAGGGHPVYAVDPFIGPQKGAFKTCKGMDGNNEKVSPEILRTNLDNIGVNGLVRIIPKKSEEAVSEIPYCELLFVDGNHEYEAVKRDFELYLPKVRDKGHVVVHDVTRADPGVVKAFDEIILTDKDHFRIRGRYNSAMVVQKSLTQVHSIYLACPGKSFCWGTVQGINDASRVQKIRLGNNNNGFDDFNALWAEAINAFEKDEVTHFAMIHSDVVPQAWWLDVLISEMDDFRADLVSVSIPIKDDRGVTTCGIGDRSNTWGAFRRFTVKEVLDMPETFSIKDTPYANDKTKYLIHNTGCFVIDLRNQLTQTVNKDGSLHCFFDFPTKVVRGKSGEWVACRESEDWFFSRMMDDVNLKTFVTRKVQLDHRGEANFPNYRPWGRDHDEDTASTWCGSEAKTQPSEQG